MTKRGWVPSVPIIGRSDKPVEQVNRDLNRAGSARSSIHKLRCQARGCKEVLAYLGFTEEGQPSIITMAPIMLPIEGVKDDPMLLWRVWLAGKTDPSAGKIYQRLDAAAPNGSRVEIFCRRGHPSTFSAQWLRARLAEHAGPT